MIDFLDEKTPPIIKGVLFLYIFFALILVMLLPFPANYIALFPQVFVCYWDIKTEGSLYDEWLKLWRNLKNGLL